MTLPKSPGRVKLPPERKSPETRALQRINHVFQQGAIQHAAEDPADDRHDPEQPQLLQSPAALENRYRGAARRVDRGVGNRNADQMDEGQRQADSDGGKARRGMFIGRAMDNQQEATGQDNFNDDSRSMEKPPGECSP